LFGSFVTIMYLLNFIKMSEPELIIVFTALSSLPIIFIYRTIEPIFDKRTRHSEIIIKNEIERIRDRISYLKSRKEKYQVFVDSDLEKLFKST